MRHGAPERRASRRYHTDRTGHCDTDHTDDGRVRSWRVRAGLRSPDGTLTHRSLAAVETKTPTLWIRVGAGIGRSVGAGSRGFEPPVSALTGPHVRPLHHEPRRRAARDQ